MGGGSGALGAQPPVSAYAGATTYPRGYMIAVVYRCRQLGMIAMNAKRGQLVVNNGRNMGPTLPFTSLRSIYVHYQMGL
jgi:hypothetical protein